MYARCVLPLTITAVLLVMIQSVYSLGVRLPLAHRVKRIASAMDCPYSTYRRASAAPLSLVPHGSAYIVDRPRRQRRWQNQRVGSAPQRALFASATSASDHNSNSQQQQQKSTSSSIRLVLDTAQDTEEFGALLCTLLLAEDENDENTNNNSIEATAAGSVIFLQGDLGAGKTCLARGFVRAAVQDWDQRVTSPTYLLSNVYQAVRGTTDTGTGADQQKNIEIHHMDLYRLSGRPQDLVPLDLDHVFSNCVSLIEWPLRLGDRIPETRLEISMRISAASSTGSSSNNDEEDDEDFEMKDKVRTMTIQPHGAVWEERLQRLLDDGYVDDLLADE